MTGVRQKSDVRREMLLDAALELFSTLGYERTTTRAVAERTHVTEAMVFRHFPSKRDLFLAVLAERGPHYLFTTAYEGLGQAPLRFALRTVLTDYLNTFWENRACLRMLIMDTWRDPPAFQELQRQFAEGTQRLQEMLERRAAAGQMHQGHAAAQADVISAALTGFLYRSVQTEPADWTAARTKFLENLLDTLFAGIEN